MAQLIFWEESPEKSKTLNYIYELFDKAQNGEFDKTVVSLIQQGFESLENADEFPVTELGDVGFDHTFVIVTPKRIKKIRRTIAKPLHDAPVCEFRVDYNGVHFRSIFFPYQYGGHQFYIFTAAFIKNPPEHPAYDPTDLKKSEAKRLHEKILENEDSLLKPYLEG
ncbi:hypothetical protein [Sporolactobacillus vineae]|uniref:hypothetical protein n=1 Tax=Sporolactobacillus vineae TaxID=444463 RepID=UPI000287F0A6|nr:hypothetical protein [Sporolactobacillus vineae]